MTDANMVIGVTDAGAPIVPAGGTCEHWAPGRNPTLPRRVCWFCRWADFRKTTAATLKQSVCRCPENQLPIIPGSENETQGG